jgi:hypothetical protein
MNKHILIILIFCTAINLTSKFSIERSLSIAIEDSPEAIYLSDLTSSQLVIIEQIITEIEHRNALRPQTDQEQQRINYLRRCQRTLINTWNSKDLILIKRLLAPELAEKVNQSIPDFKTSIADTRER